MAQALASIALPLIAAFMMPVLYRWLRWRLGVAATAVAAVTFVLVVLTPEMSLVIPWVPQLGIDLSITVDGWSRLFALLIAGIGTLVVLYSIPYLGAREDLGKFYAYLLLFMGAMLGVVYAGNLMLMYVFWELTSISSFLLIGFWNTRDDAQYGALKAILITFGGGLCMLGGLAILGTVGGTFELSALLAKQAELLGHPLVTVALVLLLIGAFTKSAQFPFHIWLPDAMAAPTPVSAYLHSATMVKAGLYLIGRLWPIFHTHPLWVPVVAAVGMVTMVVGSFLAVQKTDLKAVLALSTISQLGLIMWLFGLGTPEATQAAAFHLLNHSTFKALLFMVVGIVDHQTGTREIPLLSGLRRAMPVSAGLAMVGAASMAGVPLLNGFLSKEMFLTAVHGSSMGAAGALVATGASLLTTLYCLILGHKIWFGEPHETPDVPEEGSPSILVPPLLLAVIIVAVGIYPGLVESAIVTPAVAAVLQGPADLPHIALWHGFTPALLMTAIALGGGVLAYAGLPRVLAAFRRFTPQRYHLNALYDLLWWKNQVVEKAAKWITNRQMTGYLRDYLAYTLGALVVLFFGTMIVRRAGIPQLTLSPVGPWELLLMAIIVAGAVASTRVTSRLAAVMSISLVGLPLSLLFALLRAPDLALTQVVVEVITTVLFLLVFPHLRQITVYPRRPGRLNTNLLVAIGVGALGTVVTLLANGARLFPPRVAEWLVENSYRLGGGNNVVNVILVDFRGFDTMGEITVLTVAGLAVYMLIRLRKDHQAKGGRS